jgi:hypothetical protein
MLHTRGGRSSTHVGHGENAYDIFVEHEHEPAEYILRLQDRLQLDDVFAGIVRIFNFNIF